MRGGSLGVFGGVMKVNLQSEDATATPANTGLNRLLEAWGVRFQNNIIADAQCRQQPMNRSVDTPFGPMQAQVPVPHPPFIVAQVDEAVRENPVVYRLPEVNAFFASSLETTEVFAANHGVILFKSSDNGWALTGDSISLRIREPHDWETTQQNRFQAYNLGASVSGSLRNAFSAPVSTAPATPSPIEAPETATNARVVVMGTSLFLRDELYGQRPPAANQIAALMGIALNTVDYLVQDSDLIAVRAKSVDEPELRVPQTVQRAEAQAMAAAEQGERDEAVAAIQRGRSELEKWNGRKKFIQWLNTLGVPLLFAAIAFGYALMRKSKQAALRA